MINKLILYFLGFIIILVGLFCDPIGSNPDTGVIQLSKNSIKSLVCVLGCIFIVTGYKNENK